ncbi:MAG: hypothetical protein ABI051_01200 [Vicinamibacterales bacterium]
MAIRSSPTAEITRLIADLSSADAIKRDSAAARLAIIGAVATPRLIAVAEDAAADVAARAAALRAMTAAPNAAVIRLAGAMLRVPQDELAIEAVELCRVLMQGPEPAATVAFGQLTELALDTTAGVERRLAAVAGLETLPDALMTPVYEALSRDSEKRIVARVVRKQAGLTSTFEDLVETGFSDSPDVILALVRGEAEHARLTALRRGVDVARTRERQESGETASAWRLVRAELHEALASRGSRLALYDLRETLDKAAEPLPVGFLTAARAIGDTGCLEALAAAWVGADSADRWWRDQLADTFKSIVQRERLTRSNATLRRILSRWPSAGLLVATASK